MYSVSQKSSPYKTFCNIFTQARYISVKFCVYIASLYPHISTNFDRFILMFNKMALIFLGELIVLPFQVLSFSESDCLDFIANESGSNSPVSVKCIRYNENAELALTSLV